MIKVRVGKDLITFSGHAGFGDHGNDIVCASASSIVYTTVNGIFNIDSEAIEFNDDGKTLSIKVIAHKEIVDKLIDSMIELLEELSRQYKDNIKIDKGE